MPEAPILGDYSWLSRVERSEEMVGFLCLMRGMGRFVAAQAVGVCLNQPPVNNLIEFLMNTPTPGHQLA